MKNYSQEQLAATAGFDRSFLSMVERGIQSPNIVVLLKVAEVLGVPAAVPGGRALFKRRVAIDVFTALR